jgi:hypothetical protein
MASGLIRIIYASTASFEFNEKDLVDLLTVARNENTKINVTGILLYTERSFFQILEGHTEAVNQLFAKIAKDKRHSNVVTIIKERIAIRSFPEWSMGFADITQQDLESITGLNDFFKNGACFNQINQDRVKKLLTAFKQGQWRAKISN